MYVELSTDVSYHGLGGGPTAGEAVGHRLRSYSRKALCRCPGGIRHAREHRLTFADGKVVHQRAEKIEYHCVVFHRTRASDGRDIVDGEIGVLSHEGRHLPETDLSASKHPTV